MSEDGRSYEVLMRDYFADSLARASEVERPALVSFELAVEKWRAAGAQDDELLSACLAEYDALASSGVEAVASDHFGPELRSQYQRLCLGAKAVGWTPPSTPGQSAVNEDVVVGTRDDASNPPTAPVALESKVDEDIGEDVAATTASADPRPSLEMPLERSTPSKGRSKRGSKTPPVFTGSLNHSAMKAETVAPAQDPSTTNEVEPTSFRDAKMDQELARVADQVKALFEEGEKGNQARNYEVGVHVHQVMSDAHYGEKGVRVLAKAVGKAERTLREFASVAKRWDRPSFDALCSRLTTNGQRIGWAHLARLARIDDAVERDRMTEEVFSRGLSTRQLEQALRAPASGYGARAPHLEVRALHGRLSKMAAAICKVTDAAERVQLAWQLQALQEFAGYLCERSA